MKKILAFFLVLASSLSFAQQQKNDIVINWTEKQKTDYGDYTFTIPQFNIENFQFSASTKEITFRLRIPLAAKIDENSLQITNIVYEPVTVAQLGDVSTAAIPTTIKAKLINRQSRDKFSALLSLSPIIKDGSGYKRVRSFTYSYNANALRTVQEPNNFKAIFNSVLATGEWFRFYVTQSGAYKIDQAFLRKLGINVDNMDPRKLKIYGNGGRMIPLANSASYPNDLTENAIQVFGENDGFFNDTDYVIFYAEGVDNWNEESQTTHNLYADKSYYYINVQGTDGKRMLPMLQPSATGTAAITTFDEIQYHEVDAINIARLGRRWFGEEFDIDNEQEFNFNIPNIVTTAPVALKVYATAISLTTTSFKIDSNGQTVGSFNISGISGSNEAIAGQLTSTAVQASENMTIKVTYDNRGVPDSKGFLDYIALKSKRNLRGYGKQFRFQYNQSASSIGIGEYQLTNASGISQVWDITNIYDVTKVENNTSAFSFKANFGELRKYIAVDQNDLYYPQIEPQARVYNQNLKGTIFLNAQGRQQDVDYIIVTPYSFTGQAERLANFHRNYSGLNVKVVSLESIYQEFSSGKQDIGAIRNFMKYVYFNAPFGNKVKYLNLFGDASYDFKNRISIFSNYVPIYHSLESYSTDQSSFCSDDFFALMDDDEGNVDNDQGEADIAVGRMIASSTTQADELVTKVIDYHDTQSYGSWRNNYVAIADDPSLEKSGDYQLQATQNTLADKITLEKPFINSSKIYLDSYVQSTSSGGSRYPLARRDLFNAFEKGALVFNYLGHGGEDGLAQERIYEKSDGQNLNNKYKYPLFITITCEFSRFDNPFRPTAGEYTFLNPRGGAIAMITTVRAIFSGTGQSFNNTLAKHLFSYGSDQYTSIAEALRQAKNEVPNLDTNIVFYLGDPALMLAIPKPKIRLTKVNGMPVTGPIDDFKALSYMTITGELVDEANNPLPSYNGELSVQIFDKQLIRETLRNDGADANPSVPGSKMPFTTLGETLFRGNASVTNGQFEFGFVVPKDITTNVGNGRISFYSKRNQIHLDKTGYDTTIKVGGTNTNAPADNTGPVVKLYMNDQTFVSGGITNESPLFLAFLEDENGINTASGIGHDIVAILDGDENNPYKLNDYYETELDNYKNGKLKYPFRNLALGLHTILFKAWDVYNNLVTAEIQFIVVGDESITITNVLNYPNPFVNYTQFWFTHNKPFEPLEVQVQVLTITGKIVWTKNQTVTTDGFLSREITWDGKDDFGDKIGKGVYIYKLTVRSLITNTKTHKYEKLVIL